MINDVALIQEEINNCKYIQSNLLENKFNILYNPAEGTIKLDSWYEHGVFCSNDTCNGLNNYMFDKFKHKSCFYIVRAKGTDLNYFSEDNSVHSFLLLFDKNPMGLFGVIDIKNKIPKIFNSKKLMKKVLDKQPLLVDSSFKIITPLSQSGYTVKRVIANTHEDPHSNSVVINTFNSIPLGMNSEQDIIFLSFDFKNSNPYFMVESVSKKGSKFKKNISSPVIDSELKNDKDLLEIINIIRSKEVILSHDPFELDISLYVA